MWIIFAAGLLIISTCVLFFLHRVVKIKYIPAYVTVLAFVAFLIPISIVVLLPVDLASGRADDLNSERKPEWPISYLNHTVLLKIWRAAYWLSFSLTLTILPLTQTFVESGYREPLRKLIGSIRQNLIYQALYLLIGLVAILYIVLNTKFNSVSDFKSLLIALTNTWGLFLAINLLGHGLVNLPRRLWRSANYLEQIHDIEVRAPMTHERLEDAKLEESDLAARIVALERTTADKEWLEEMARMIPSAVAKARLTTRSRTSSSWFGGNRDARDPTDAELAALMSKIRINARERYNAEWNQLVLKYAYLRDCTSNSSSRTIVHRMFRSRLNPRMAHYYYAYVSLLLRRLVAISAGLLSASILWAEILINQERPFLRFITLPITKWNIEFWSAALLAYMACCCYSTLLRLKFFDKYALLDHGHTSQSSLFFYASYFCRVTIPLSYNFITLLPADYRDLSTFSKFLASAIDLTPLGVAFNKYFPLYILVPVLLTLANSYDRVKQTLGYNSTWIDDDDEYEGSAAEGRTLLQNDLAQRYGELSSRYAQSDVAEEEEEARIGALGDQLGARELATPNSDDAEDSAPLLTGSGKAPLGMRAVLATRATFSDGWLSLKNQVKQSVASTRSIVGSWTRLIDDPNVV